MYMSRRFQSGIEVTNASQIYYNNNGPARDTTLNNPSGRIMYQGPGGAAPVELGTGGGGGAVPDPLTLTNTITTTTGNFLASAGDIIATAGKVQAGDNVEAGTIGAPTVSLNGVSGNVGCTSVTAATSVATPLITAVSGAGSVIVNGATGAVSASGNITADGVRATSGNLTADTGDVEVGANARVGAAVGTQSILLNGTTADITIGRAVQGAGPGEGKLVTSKIDVGPVGGTADIEIFTDVGLAGTNVRIAANKALSVLDSGSQAIFGVQQAGAVFPVPPLFPYPGDFQFERYTITKTNFEIHDASVGGQSLFNSGASGTSNWTRLSDSTVMLLPQGLYIMQIDQEANPPLNCPITGFRAHMFYHNNGFSNLGIRNSLNVFASTVSLLQAAGGAYVLGSGRGAQGPEVWQFGGGPSIDNYVVFPGVAVPSPQIATTLTVTMTWVAPN
tara:strand:+ start:4506 stop:5846 length:1341 start_codon:yes stop_codon:yes gene_type:complete